MEGLIIQGKVDTFTGAEASAWVTAALDRGDPRAVYDAAKAQGISMTSLDALMGWPASTSAAWAQANGLPRFASGGEHFGGLRLVGELGPELEATGPSRVHSSDSLLRLLRADPAGTPKEARESANSKSSGAEAAAEIRALRDEQRRQSAASVALQLRMTKLLERWEQAGIPETRTA